MVIVDHQEKRKRKKGGKRSDQVYYYLSDGRVKHASYFKRVNIKEIKRDYYLNKILND